MGGAPVAPAHQRLPAGMGARFLRKVGHGCARRVGFAAINPTLAVGVAHGASVLHHWALDALDRRVRGLAEQRRGPARIDVRTIPRSRTNPQYNSEALAEALSESRIDYAHIAALGGLRGRKRDVPADVNAFWQVAMPPTDRRLSDRRRRDGIPHSRARGAEATGLHANIWMIFWRALISGHT